MGLQKYHRKRDFTRTAEPRGKRDASRKRAYVIQKHAASRLHYDLRLEYRGVLLSWAVPKGPSLDPADKRLAVHVEDHPVDYGDFEGTIPKGEYGGGSVLLWDRGTWTPNNPVDEGLRKGKLEFTLHGEKLQGTWKLIRLRDPASGGDDKNWLLMKGKDTFARRGSPAITEARPESVLTGKGIEEIGSSAPSSKAKAPAKKRRSTAAARAGKLKGAVRAKLPGFVPLQLATLVDSPPEGGDWIHEVKYDGYRMLAEVDGGHVRWYSRNGLDWTERFTDLSPALTDLPAEEALLDGEVVVLAENGVSHFQRLQQALKGETADALTYFAFDLLHSDGYDLRQCRLEDRKALLETLLSETGNETRARYSEHFETSGALMLQAACAHELEGIISKRRDGRYVSGRTRDWTKAKCGQRQEFVVVGFTEPQRSRVGIGALVLGVNEKKGLRFAGRVGTGFDRARLASLRKTLEGSRTSEVPVMTPLSAENRRGVRWVDPRMVVEVAFTGWTSDGLLRHPSFVGVREDKNVKDVIREKAAIGRLAPRKSAATASRNELETEVLVGGVRISHPDRVVDAKSGVTKLDLARYCEKAAARLLPHLQNRPVSVVRCPDGFAGTCFFQKHHGKMFSKAVKSITLADSRGKSQYLAVDSLESLLALVQMNVVEFHPWGSRADQLEKPDRLFFDLDPAPDVPWTRVIEAALQMRRVLAGMDIDSFVKTTGGKGIHVIVPIARKYTWDEVKAFSKAIAFELARTQPKQYVAVANKDARKGKIFIDYLRNSRGATAVAPYSVRARAGAPISIPISWKGLEKLEDGGHFHLGAGAPVKATGRDPWTDFSTSAQKLPRGTLKL